MAVPMGVLLQDHHSRPAMHRARSHSSPSHDAVPPADSLTSVRPTRPAHTRSHSLLPPGATLPEDASKPATPLEKIEKSAADKVSRLHLPGRHISHRRDDSDEPRRRRSKIHRYTQSLAEHHHHTNSHAYPTSTTAMHSSRLAGKRRNHPHLNDAATDSLPNLVAGLNAERTRGHHASPSDPSSISPPTLQRMNTTRSYRGLAAGDAAHHLHDPSTRPSDLLRRRATSDPRAPSYDTQGNPITRPKTQIELDLERADRLRRQRRITLTVTDLTNQDTALRAAEDELRDTLQEISHAGMEITRRLDYGFYNLLEKVGNLAGVIHSFQTLATQSRHLITNLENEANKTDEHVKGKAERLREQFDEREERIVRLEERGRATQRRAKELGERLERARKAVERWEKRETERQRVWGRFLARVWWTVVGIVVVVLVVVVVREVAAGAGGLKGMNELRVGKGDGAGGAAFVNGTRQVEVAMERVPDDVKEVLREIEERHRVGGATVDVGRNVAPRKEPPVPPAVRMLDEL